MIATCNGVPVRMRRCFDSIARNASLIFVFSFLILCPSSNTTYCHCGFRNLWNSITAMSYDVIHRSHSSGSFNFFIKRGRSVLLACNTNARNDGQKRCDSFSQFCSNDNGAITKNGPLIFLWIENRSKCQMNVLILCKCVKNHMKYESETSIWREFSII